MPDHFATLEQPRRPWLDAAALKECFHRASATLHPDVPGTGDAMRFTALNAAYAVLRDPAARARHLLELEAPDLLTATAPPPALADFFMRQAALHQRVAAFLRQRSAAATPLARALLAGEAADLQEAAATTRSDLDTTYARALDELRALDDLWIAPPPHEQLAELQRRLAFLGKWRTQLRETVFQLGS